MRLGFAGRQGSNTGGFGQADVAGWAAMGALLCASAGWQGMEVVAARLSQQTAAGACPELFPLLEVRMHAHARDHSCDGPCAARAPLRQCCQAHSRAEPLLHALRCYQEAVMPDNRPVGGHCQAITEEHCAAGCVPARAPLAVFTPATLHLVHSMFQVPGMTAARARALYAAGLADAEDVAASDQARVERALARALPPALRAPRRGPGQREDPKQAAARAGVTGRAAAMGSCGALLRRSWRVRVSACPLLVRGKGPVGLRKCSRATEFTDRAKQ